MTLAAVVTLVTIARPALAQPEDGQQSRLFGLDASLRREPCTPRPTVPAVIVLDGSGRFVDLVATQGRPAYWSPTIDRVTIRNEPTQPSEGELPNDLVLEADKPGGLPEDTRRWAVPAGGAVDLPRRDTDPLSNAGLLQVKVKRHGVEISSLWFILREPNVILLTADGPVDPIYRSAAVPAHLPCDFKLEYVPDPKAKLPAPVIVAPRLATEPASPQALLPLQVPGSGTVDVPWARLRAYMRSGAPDVQLVVLKGGRAVSVIWVTQQAQRGFASVLPGGAQPGPAPGTPGAARQTPQRIDVLLDRLGVASPAFLNRRRPAYIPPAGDNVEIMFTSLASDRAFIVSFSGIPEEARPELVRSGAQIGACRDGRCSAAIRVPPGGSAAVAVSALRAAYARAAIGSTVTFTVAFFDDDTTPVNSRGYLTFFDAPYFAEPGSSTSWTGALSVNLTHDPDLSATIPPGQKTAAITTANPFARSSRTHVGGSATAGLKQNLGNRADFELELTAKSGDFGQESALKASKYLANVYTSHGITLTGGRMDVAAPSEAIAFSESGDAVGFGVPVCEPQRSDERANGQRRCFGYASAGYVFRKQVAADGFTAKKAQEAIDNGAPHLERTNRDLVLQIRDIRTGRFRTGVFGVIGDATRGRLRTTGDQTELIRFDSDAWSIGAETLVNFGNANLSLGLYRSERSSDAAEDLRRPADRAEGNVGLLSFRYTNIDHDRFEGNQLAADFSLTAQVGRGGSYVGENQAFAPDALFLSKFAGLLVDSDAPIGPGLTNKWYFGLIATTPKVAPGKGVATLELHHYHRAEPRAGSRNLGTEASLEFRFEQPKGVRYQVLAAGFRPGRALNTDEPALRLLTKFQWLVRLGVTVRMD
jgi:hypothetical protein